MKLRVRKGYKCSYERQPLSLLPVVVIALASTFLRGWGIEKAGTLLHLPEKVLTSLVLLGTLKDDGRVGGLALALFSKKTSVLRLFRLFS